MSSKLLVSIFNDVIGPVMRGELPKDCPCDEQGRPSYLREVAVLAVPDNPTKTLASRNQVKTLVPGPDFRRGLVRDTDGTETMIIWVRQRSTQPLNYEIY